MLAFYKPSTIEEALKLRTSVPKSVFLGGGTILNSLSWTKAVENGHVQDYEALIDVSELDLGGIEKREGELRIGANVCLQDVMESELCPPLLLAGLKQFVNRNVRNVATLGGGLAIKSPCSDANNALLALHAEIELVNEKGTRRITIEDYLNAPQDDSLIVAIYVSDKWASLPSAVRRYSRSSNDISIVLADVAIQMEDGKVKVISAVAGGVAKQSVRLKALEEAVLGNELPSSERVAELVAQDTAAIDDLRGSAEFKTYMAGQLVDWCLHNAAPEGVAYWLGRKG